MTKIIASKTGKYLAFLLLIIFYLLFSYNYFGNWWHSAMGSVLIIVFSYLIWKNNFLTIIGLRLNWKNLLITIILAISLTAISIIIMKQIADGGKVTLSYINWISTNHIIFYVLNEEIVLGSITLYLLIKKLNIKAIHASLLLALAFSIVHLIFYRWIFNDQVFLQFTTLITLFLVGVIRNNLILQTGHIGYSWALHASWMIAMFGFDHIYKGDKTSISEAGRFDLYLGSIIMLVISGVLAIVSVYFLLKRKIKFTEIRGLNG